MMIMILEKKARREDDKYHKSDGKEMSIIISDNLAVILLCCNINIT